MKSNGGREVLCEGPRKRKTWLIPSEIPGEPSLAAVVKLGRVRT
jgi:hypothetical protein